MFGDTRAACLKHVGGVRTKHRSGTQYSSLNLNWTTRGKFACELTRPKFAAVMLVLMPPNRTEFSKLKTSAPNPSRRSCTHIVARWADARMHAGRTILDSSLQLHNQQRCALPRQLKSQHDT